MIRLIFRKKTREANSIEQIFDALLGYFEGVGVPISKIELPFSTTGVVPMLRNALCIRRYPDALFHITGDIHYAALLARPRRLIITVHDCVLMHTRTGLRRFVFKWLGLRLPIRQADAITTVSEKTKRELLQYVAIPQERVLVIPNFVDAQFFGSPKTQCDGQCNILHIGTTPNKNLIRVVQALAGLHVSLTIVGKLDGDQVRALSNAKLQFSNCFDVSKAEIAGLYAAADLVSFPSLYEGFGMPVIEGQAAARPVLTSDIDPMREIAGDGGALLVDPYSVESIRRGFVSLIEDQQLRQRLVQAGSANAVKYSIQAIGQLYLDLYEKTYGAVLSRNPSRP